MTDHIWTDEELVKFITVNEKYYQCEDCKLYFPLGVGHMCPAIDAEELLEGFFGDHSGGFMGPQEKPLNKPIEEILKERGSIYGDARENLALTQILQDAFDKYYDKNDFYTGRELHPADEKTRNAHKNAMHMALHKIARIATAQGVCEDSYDDGCGYLTLGKKIITGEPCV